MKRKSSVLITKMVTVALLVALGIVLMLYVKFPFPMAAWCEVEFSDTVILVAYALTGFWGAFFVAIIKTLISLLVQPVGIFFIGQITALISSLVYLLCIALCASCFRFFNKGFVWRLVSYVITAVVVSVVLSTLNYLFITPTYLAGYWTTCFNSEIVDQIVSSFSNYGNSYAAIIFSIYVPFNLLKALIVCGVYEALFNPLIFIVIKQNPKFSKYFKLESHKEEKSNIKSQNN